MGYVTYRLGALSGPAQVPHSVICEQAERVIEPCRTPPVPAEAPTIPRPHQVAPDLPLDPPLHYGKAPARVPDPEVVDPAPQLRVDRGDQLLGRLGLIASEYLLELLQQRRTLLPLWRILRPPAPPHRADAPEVEAQKIQSSPPDSGPRSGSSPRSAAHRVSPALLAAVGLPPPPASPADDRCARGSPGHRRSARTRRTCACRWP